mmetsp:Transcript_35138/g.41927  ORF Transcript_35138/g.41927 Transcript_35138/m.41927 type:complete len:208 (+) Transcript_35138:74-697(+)
MDIINAHYSKHLSKSLHFASSHYDAKRNRRHHDSNGNSSNAVTTKHSRTSNRTTRRTCNRTTHITWGNISRSICNRTTRGNISRSICNRTTRRTCSRIRRYHKMHNLPSGTMLLHITRKRQCLPRVGLLNHILRLIEDIPYEYRTCYVAITGWVDENVVGKFLGPFEGDFVAYGGGFVWEYVCGSFGGEPFEIEFFGVGGGGLCEKE